jgi:(5-formylfuran-3-yl)methyl phosphate synthase
MTLFLASVRDAEEAEMAIGAGANIIDLKDPGQGALGALVPDTIAACVRRIAARAPVSATIGDLPLEGEVLRNAVLATAALGVDYVKVGLFPDGDAERSLNLLTTEAAQIRLIVVLFADALPDFDAIGLAARIGAHGVMFDTMGKDAGSLPDHMSFMALAEYIASAKAEGLVVGLAGSLKAKHVASLVALSPDLLGFRGALCQRGDRSEDLDPVRLAAIRALIPERPRILNQPNLANLAPQSLC